MPGSSIAKRLNTAANMCTTKFIIKKNYPIKSEPHKSIQNREYGNKYNKH